MTHNDPSQQNAKHVTHSITPKVAKRGYRSQVGRKYNAKHRAASARWTESKGFQTREEKLKNPKDLTKDPTSDAYQAPPTPNTGPSNEQELRSARTPEASEGDQAPSAPSASATKGLGFQGSWFDMAAPTNPNAPAPRPLYVPEIPALPDLTMLPEGCKRRVYQWQSGRYFEWDSAEPIQVVSRSGNFYDSQGIRVHVVNVAARPAFMQGLPKPELNKFTGDWTLFKPAPSPEPAGPSYNQRYGRTASLAQSQPLIVNRPACNGPCTCSYRDCGRR